MPSYYPVLLGLQIAITHVDIIFNVASILAYGNNIVLLMLYMLQDTAIVMAFIVLVISFSTTFVFRAGLIILLLKRFSLSLVATLSYLALSVCLHYVTLSLRWENPVYNIWSSWMLAFHTLHKIAAVLYYHSYKRTAFLLSDPKYHGLSEWLRYKVQNN